MKKLSGRSSVLARALMALMLFVVAVGLVGSASSPRAAAAEKPKKSGRAGAAAPATAPASSALPVPGKTPRTILTCPASSREPSTRKSTCASVKNTSTSSAGCLSRREMILAARLHASGGNEAVRVRLERLGRREREPIAKPSQTQEPPPDLGVREDVRASQIVNQRARALEVAARGYCPTVTGAPGGRASARLRTLAGDCA